jgi:hypothetical protein
VSLEPGGTDKDGQADRDATTVERQRAERRLVEEMARHRRTEQRQLATMKWGCIGLLAAMVLLLVLGFFFS